MKKYKPNEKGQFRKHRKIHIRYMPSIQCLINLISCSYYAYIGNGTYHLRSFDYFDNVINFFKKKDCGNE